ncbi:MAG: long-chain fatty acid--CoA ligase [Candidatus Abyssobacteria bacterium SURF_5]|uniref:Long-chain fatty acid--CoA ligase n=1 Tax=Abyssobacteria bacterium (strain SURF_5) TaxID=2093360 RepID=A0A3A4N544_ABYX5|nr:MAG: long-chain fatty acid--CoA ligase [Candidatus Abyssubacteria bacterium SURF_5]
MDLGIKLKLNAEEFPDKPAIIFNDKQTTYKEINERAARFGNALMSLGLKRRERVAVIMRNRTEFLEIIHGLIKAGITLVPVNWRLAPEEMRYVIDNSDASAVVVSSEFLEKLTPIMKQLPKVAATNYIHLGEDCPAGMHPYEQLLRKASAAEPGVENQPGDPLFIGYTSGTTGFPKGAITPHGDWDIKMLSLFGLLRLDENAVQLLTMPLFHMNAINTSTVSHYGGQTVVVMERFRPEEALRLIEKYKANFSSMVPTMYNRLKNMPPDVFEKYDTSAMKSLIQSSAPLPFSTKKWIVENFPSAGLHELYGGTEAGLVTYLPPEEQLARPGSVGRALPTIEIKLVDDDGNEVPVGQVGQFISRPREGATLGKVTEYYKDEKSTKKSFKGGWFYSGDMARMDEDGFYYLVDRKFDMIISGGENIYPAEIEGILYRHPKVLEAAVIGVPDDEWGESVKAVIVLKEREKASAEEIISYCREHLAGYKVPRSVDFVDDLPKTDTGKILKKIIKEPYWKGRETKI